MEKIVDLKEQQEKEMINKVFIYLYIVYFLFDAFYFYFHSVFTDKLLIISCSSSYC